MRPPALLAPLLALALFIPGGTAASPEGPERQRLVLETGERAVTIFAEVADTADERRVGLMHRRSLPRNAGMLFRFPGATRGGFWMKNTLIPLSIAFLDRRGRILRILDMVPCRADPCRIYDPGVAYRYALEVNRGAFRRWDARPGDTVVLPRP